MAEKIDFYDIEPSQQSRVVAVKIEEAKAEAEELGLMLKAHSKTPKRVANFGQDAKCDTKGEIIYATIYHLARC